jgi:hypothetical protein
MHDEVALIQQILNKIKSELTDDMKLRILECWDDYDMPIDIIHKHTGVAFRVIREYLIQTGRLEEDAEAS